MVDFNQARDDVLTAQSVLEGVENCPLDGQPAYPLSHFCNFDDGSLQSIERFIKEDLLFLRSFGGVAWVVVNMDTEPELRAIAFSENN